MALVSRTAYVAGTTIQSTAVNANENTIFNDYNGNVTNVNVASAAAIAASKLNLGTIAQLVAMSSQALNFAKGADIASATTTAIGAATGNCVDVTGTTTITAFDTIQAGTVRYVRFTGALTLTYNASSLILPGSANITTANGDVAGFESLGSGNWKCLFYQKQDGTAVSGGVAATQAEMEAASSTTVFTTPGREKFHPGVAKAWVQFTGTGTVTINASNNVTSITDNGTGDYTINFTTAFSAATYCWVGSGYIATNHGCVVCRSDTAGPSASALRIETRTDAGNLTDADTVCVAVFGDFA